MSFVAAHVIATQDSNMRHGSNYTQMSDLPVPKLVQRVNKLQVSDTHSALRNGLIERLQDYATNHLMKLYKKGLAEETLLKDRYGRVENLVKALEAQKSDQNLMTELNKSVQNISKGWLRYSSFEYYMTRLYNQHVKS